MEILRTHSAEEFEQFANDCLKGHDGCVIHIAKKPNVWTGVYENTFDRNECEKRGLYVGKGQYLGGTIVCSKEDVSVCYTSLEKEGFAERIHDATLKWLKAKNINVTTDNNDILADGKKVFSWGRASAASGYTQTVVHYSVNIDLDLIKTICKKPMEKTPGALSDYGVAAEECEAVIMEALTNTSDR